LHYATNRRALISSLALLPALPAPLVILGGSAQAAASDGELASWNEGAAKQAILDFVRAATDPANSNHVPAEDRIAVFDQDGTLWVEHPMYTQVMYCLERVPAVVAKKPELKDVAPFKTVLSGDREAIAKLSLHDLEEILFATLTGMPVEEFEAEAKKWLETARHPRETALHRLGLSADARGPAIAARQRIPDLYRDRRGTGLRAGLLPASLWHPARTGGGNRSRNKIRLRQGWQAIPDQGAEAALERQRRRQA